MADNCQLGKNHTVIVTVCAIIGAAALGLAAARAITYAIDHLLP